MLYNITDDGYFDSFKMIDGFWRFVLHDDYENTICSYVKFTSACAQIADPPIDWIVQYGQPELLMGDYEEHWYEYKYYSIQKTFLSYTESYMDQFTTNLFNAFKPANTLCNNAVYTFSKVRN